MITNIVYILKTYFFLLYFILFFWPTVSTFHAHLLALSHISAARLTVFKKKMLSLKQHQNMKIMFSCIQYGHIPPPPHPPQFFFIKKLFYTGKLYGMTGMGCSQVKRKLTALVPIFCSASHFHHHHHHHHQQQSWWRQSILFPQEPNTKRFKWMLIYFAMDTQYANFGGILHTASVSK